MADRQEDMGSRPVPRTCPKHWVVSLGTDEPFAQIEIDGVRVLEGGGVLCSIPSTDDTRALFARVHPLSGRLTVFEIDRDRKSATILSRALLPLPTEEMDVEATEPPPTLPIDWIDC